MKIKETGLFRCDFCDKHQNEVEQMIAGPNYVSICNDCISTAMSVLLNIIKNQSLVTTPVEFKRPTNIPKGGF